MKNNKLMDSKEGFKGNLGSLYINIMYAIIINITIYGRRKRNHETDSYPFLQSRLRIHVQKRT
jgi:hypothetical protein